MNKSKALIAVIAVAVVGFAATRLIPAKEDQVITPQTGPVTNREDSPSTEALVYKDGTYSARGTYKSPAGIENISVTVTLKDGIVTDSTAVGQATDSKSIRFQGLFIDGYKQYVVGKSLDEVLLDKVSGSSLTGAGFNDAIEKIKVEARA